MRVGGKPGPTRMQTSPPAYLKHQGSAGPRLSPTYILFILWRALLVNRSILLIQIIRKLHLPLVILCNLTCRISRPHPGNDDHLVLCLSLLMLLYYPFVLSVPRQSSARGRKRTSRSKSRTCLNRRLQLKNRQLPLLLKPPLQPTSQPQKLLLTRRPPARLSQPMTRTW